MTSRTGLVGCTARRSPQRLSRWYHHNGTGARDHDHHVIGRVDITVFSDRETKQARLLERRTCLSYLLR